MSVAGVARLHPGSADNLPAPRDRLHSRRLRCHGAHPHGYEARRHQHRQAGETDGAHRGLWCPLHRASNRGGGVPSVRTLVQGGLDEDLAWEDVRGVSVPMRSWSRVRYLQLLYLYLMISMPWSIIVGDLNAFSRRGGVSFVDISLGRIG